MAHEHWSHNTFEGIVFHNEYNSIATLVYPPDHQCVMTGHYKAL